jgi:hypothetical protein
MGLLKDHRFWIGVAVGALVVPPLMKKAAPSVSQKMPGK